MIEASPETNALVSLALRMGSGTPAHFSQAVAVLF